MTIRRYREADHARIMVLQRVAMEAIGFYKDDPHLHSDLNDIPGNYLDNRGEFAVGEADGTIVAMGGIRPFGNNLAEVKRMRVDPSCQRMGYGREVLEYLIRRAGELGYSGMVLETSVKQTAAQRLYTKCGFVETGREIIDGFDCIWYKKILPPPRNL